MSVTTGIDTPLLPELTFITMTHNRNGQRARNFILSLLEQTIQVSIVVVDTSSSHANRSGIAGLTPDIRLIYLSLPSPTFNKSKALNLGLSVSITPYLAFTDIDFIFHPTVAETLLSHMRSDPSHFLLSEALYLPPDLSVEHPFDWEMLISKGEFHGRLMSPGTIQVSHADWFTYCGGYDEAYEGGLGGMDDDMIARARKGELNVKWLPRHEIKCLHQWHEPSELKGVCSDLFDADPPVVKNQR